MPKIRIVNTVGALREALADVDDDQPFEFVYASGFASGVVILELDDKNDARVIVSVRSLVFNEPGGEPIVHKHDQQDWHDHSYTDYLAHSKPIENEQLPPL
jgi:hypothetical protein